MMNTIKILTAACILLLCYSCNTSLSVLDRRYRPGYTVEFSKDCAPQRDGKLPEPMPVVPVYSNEELAACAEESGSSISCSVSLQKPLTLSSPDTVINKALQPGQKNSERKIRDQVTGIKRNLKAQAEGESSGKPMEPFNLLACFLLGVGILVGVLLHLTGLPAVLLFILTLALVFVFSLISMRRMERYPDRYSKLSKVLNYIFAICGLIMFIVFWIIFKIIGWAE